MVTYVNEFHPNLFQESEQVVPWPILPDRGALQWWKWAHRDLHPDWYGTEQDE